MGEQQGAFGYTITWSRLLRGPDDLDLKLQAHRGRKHLTLLTHTSHITCRDQTRILTLKRCTLTSSPQTTCPCTYTLILRRTTQMCTTQITCREYTRTTTLKNHDWRPNPRCPIKIPPTREANAPHGISPPWRGEQKGALWVYNHLELPLEEPR